MSRAMFQNIKQYPKKTMGNIEYEIMETFSRPRFIFEMLCFIMTNQYPMIEQNVKKVWQTFLVNEPADM